MRRFVIPVFIILFVILPKPAKSQSIADLQKTASDLVSAGKLSEAEPVYIQIVKADSADFDANVWLGNYYYLKGKDAIDDEDSKYNSVKEPSRMQMALHMDKLKSFYTDYFAVSEPYLDRAYRMSKNEYLKKTLGIIYDYKLRIGVIKPADKSVRKTRPGR
jgi:hypothetical protein